MEVLFLCSILCAASRYCEERSNLDLHVIAKNKAIQALSIPLDCFAPLFSARNDAKRQKPTEGQGLFGDGMDVETCHGASLQTKQMVVIVLRHCEERSNLNLKA